MLKRSEKREKYCNLIYTTILKDIITPIAGNNTTYLSELLEIGKKLLGDKFKGVYPSDKIPKLNELSPYAILNLDTSRGKGSHWVAIAKKDNNTYFLKAIKNESEYKPQFKICVQMMKYIFNKKQF